MIQVYKTFTSDNLDALSGTDLDPIPAGLRVAVVYVASTQTDTVVTCQAPNETTARKVQVPQTTTGSPDMASTPGIIIPLTAGGKLVIDIDIVTGATVGLLVQAS